LENKISLRRVRISYLMSLLMEAELHTTPLLQLLLIGQTGRQTRWSEKYQTEHFNWIGRVLA